MDASATSAETDASAPPTSPRKPPSIGYDAFFCHDLSKTLEICRAAKFDFCVLPLVHPRLERSCFELGSTMDRACARQLPLTRSDVLLSSRQWSTMVVGRVSRWIRFDASTATETRAAELALKEEVAWATHLSLAAVLVPPLSGRDADYARALLHLMVKAHAHLNVWLEVPLGGGHDAWQTWSRFRVMCDHSPSLHAALVVSQDLPGEHDADLDVIVARWCGEPVRVLVWPTSVFISNPSGYPTLGARHRTLFLAFYVRGVQFVVSGRARHANGLLPYQMYLTHLATRAAGLTEREEFESPFYDYLQVPLQPLGDNLESQTYETFEQDPVKYARYQQAVEQALLNVPGASPAAAAAGPAAAQAQARDLTVMVVGAGRGPLVKAVLRAADNVHLAHRVRVYAVEKNPNAIVTLLNAHRHYRWGDRVTIVSKDMRHWEAPELADIIVSELLGSWGDNELSPECLDGVERFLRPGSGVSIPCSYTSYVAPIMSHKVWVDVRALSKSATDTDAVTASVSVSRFETCYVVRLSNFFEVAPALPCFRFEHGPRAAPLPSGAHERAARLHFTASADALVHGFAGYFEAQLYGDVMISILPRTFSQGMFSWFPLFIPLREPLVVAKHQSLHARFWRKTSAQKVWFEWCAGVAGGLDDDLGPLSAVHNPSGRSSWVAL